VKSVECRHRAISLIAIIFEQSSVGLLQDKRAPVIAFEFENLNHGVHDALGRISVAESDFVLVNDLRARSGVQFGAPVDQLSSTSRRELSTNGR
jgi:hypothetical protein